MLASPGMTAPAFRAVAAVLEGKNHMIPGMNTLYVLTHLDNNSRAFMPEYNWLGNRILRLTDTYIGMANAGSNVPHQDLILTRALKLNGLNLVRPSLFT
jgi:hypothetical protein